MLFGRAVGPAEVRRWRTQDVRDKTNAVMSPWLTTKARTIGVNPNETTANRTPNV
jgi:hypothetical protein